MQLKYFLVTENNLTDWDSRTGEKYFKGFIPILRI